MASSSFQKERDGGDGEEESAYEQLLSSLGPRRKRRQRRRGRLVKQCGELLGDKDTTTVSADQLDHRQLLSDGRLTSSDQEPPQCDEPISVHGRNSGTSSKAEDLSDRGGSGDTSRKNSDGGDEGSGDSGDEGRGDSGDEGSEVESDGSCEVRSGDSGGEGEFSALKGEVYYVTLEWKI